MGQIDTLLLAGRRNESDPLLQAPGSPDSKALIDLNGRRMIDWVMAAVTGSGVVRDVFVSGIGGADLPDGVKPAAPGAGPASAIVANEGIGAPLLVTTCDHPLLTGEILRDFIARAQATEADLVVGFATRSTIEKSYAGMRRTYLMLGGEGYSGCNLFLVRTQAGFEAIRFWSALEAHRKSPRKLAFLIGPGLMLRYLFRRFMTIDRLMAYASRRTGVKIAAALLPFAEAAVDVDKPSDLDFARQIILSRA